MWGPRGLTLHLPSFSIANGMQHIFDIFRSYSSNTYVLISWLVGWLAVLFYGVSTLFGSFNAEFSHFDKISKQFSLREVQCMFCLYTVKLSKQFYFKQFSLVYRTLFKYQNSPITNNSV